MGGYSGARSISQATAPCYFYFCWKGDPDAALEVLRRAVDRGQQSFLPLYWVNQYQRDPEGSQLEVQQVLEGAKPLDNKEELALLHAWVLLESLESPKGVATVRRFYADIKTKHNSFETSLWTIPIAYLVGDRDQAKTTALEVRQKYPRTPWRNGFYSDLVNFCAGDFTVEQLEKIGCDSNLNKGQGDFFIGMKLLSEGDRRGAAEHFRKAIDTPFETAEEHYFNQAFLGRLEKNPDWPPWIPKKEAERR